MDPPSRRNVAHSSLQTDEDFSVLDLSKLNIADPNDQGAAKWALSRLLSIKSVISTTSTEASKQRPATDKHLQAFRIIGKGFCGEVYEKIGTNRVYKRELNFFDQKLWNDRVRHLEIYTAVNANNQKVGVGLADDTPLTQIPKPFNFITSESNDWWTENGAKFPRIASRTQARIWETERIQPLPKAARRALIALYAPKDQNKGSILRHEKNKNCLARVYLGVRRKFRPRTGDFSLQNFELDLEMMDNLGLEKGHHAKEMGRVLAIIHFECKLDADDVEFVLGSAPTEVSLTVQEVSQLPPNTADETILNFKKRAVYLFLLDFNNCAPITMNEEGMIKAKQSFYNNDPYFPRPKVPGTEDGDIWRAFTASYLQQAAISANEEARKNNLAQRFIELLVSDP